MPRGAASEPRTRESNRQQGGRRRLHNLGDDLSQRPPGAASLPQPPRQTPATAAIAPSALPRTAFGHSTSARWLPREPDGAGPGSQPARLLRSRIHRFSWRASRKPPAGLRLPESSRCRGAIATGEPGGRGLSELELVRKTSPRGTACGGVRSDGSRWSAVGVSRGVSTSGTAVARPCAPCFRPKRTPCGTRGRRAVWQ